VADGVIDADLMDVEGEHSVLSVLQGACLAGARTYTATCGQGLAFMFEPYFRTPPLRLPIVMSIVTRDGITPQCVWGGQQDAMTVKEVGWIQMYCETNQEILDTMILAYRVAENRDVMLPVNVCHDGNYQSYGVEQVLLPDQDMVDGFLGEKDTNWHAALDPEKPMGIDPLTGGAGGEGPSRFVRYRKGSCKGMQNALDVITNVHEEWGELTGRHYAPLVEEYRLDDADYAIVTIGGMTGAGKDAVDEMRLEGENVGLIKIKTFRPFPQEALLKAVSKVAAVGVVDRSVNFGWNSGPVYQEILGILYQMEKKIPAVSFIGGLAGADITINDFKDTIMTTKRALNGDLPKSTIWINE
jgi:pyruvate ferredoxin oxidoreductase alpha subunit/phenylglyoxylate dehydrogenase alpha subunit